MNFQNNLTKSELKVSLIILLGKFCRQLNLENVGVKLDLKLNLRNSNF